MKAQRASLWLLGTVFLLSATHARGLRRCLIAMDMRHLGESFQHIKGTIQAKDTFPNVTILSTSGTLHSIKYVCGRGYIISAMIYYFSSGFSAPDNSSNVCCVTKNLLAFYVDRVFKDHQELSPQILRKISSIANSFLYMQKVLQQCEQRLCHCGQEAANATRIIHDNYNQLEARSAALKSLGELDVFLAWIDKNHQGTPAA